MEIREPLLRKINICPWNFYIGNGTFLKWVIGLESPDYSRHIRDDF